MMASNSTKNSNSPLLPMSTATDSAPRRTEDKLFKGSAMTKRGAYAAISYMSCAAGSSNSASIIMHFDKKRESAWASDVIIQHPEIRECPGLGL